LPESASVLEIGSGTGEHGIETLAARPDLAWQFSDPDPASRLSQAAWAEHLGLSAAAPLNLDMSDAQSRAQTKLASKVVKPDGQMILYGPFLFGTDSAPSNLDFDASLKRRNSAWGVREIESVKHIFAKNGFNVAKLRDMPKNNFLLGLSRG